MSEFPDVVALLIAYLADEIEPEVHNDVPADRPDEFLQVRRIGGVAELPVRDFPNIELKAWAQTSYEAMQLLRGARARVWELANVGTLGRDDDQVAVYTVAELAGPRQGNDEDSGHATAQMTASLAVRADPVIRFTN